MRVSQDHGVVNFFFSPEDGSVQYNNVCKINYAILILL